MVNIGLSDDHDADGEVVHLIGKPVLDDGKLSGTRIERVSDNTAGSTLGGTMKCIASSLQKS